MLFWLARPGRRYQRQHHPNRNAERYCETQSDGEATSHTSASSVGQFYSDVGETEFVVSDGVWATSHCGVSRCYLRASGVASHCDYTEHCGSRHFLCNAAQGFGKEWETTSQ